MSAILKIADSFPALYGTYWCAFLHLQVISISYTKLLMIALAPITLTGDIIKSRLTYFLHFPMPSVALDFAKFSV